MFDLDNMQTIDPLGPKFGKWLTTRVAGLSFAIPRTQLVVEGSEHLPDGPAIFSPNHTHKFDFLPVRYALIKTHRLITWIKARDYNDPMMRAFFDAAGNLPIASRGYIISADFIAQRGTRPTETEYRALRDHVDHGEPLPEGAPFDDLQSNARSIGGVGFDPTTTTYRNAIQETYRLYMEQTLRLAKIVRDAGAHQHIYPQGAVSRQLTPGKTGAVQAAMALGLPIVPVGISGCIESFYKNTPWSSGAIKIRIGEPIEFDAPTGARFFDAEWEAENATSLNAQTEQLMGTIHDLVDHHYGWASNSTSDGKTGVARFI